MASEKNYEKLDTIIRQKSLLKFRQKTRDEKHEYFKFMTSLNYALDSLSYEYKRIMNHTYFERDYKFWWIDEYCKSSFYRKRDKAVASFVHMFELVYENFYHFSNNLRGHF